MNLKVGLISGAIAILLGFWGVYHKRRSILMLSIEEGWNAGIVTYIKLGGDPYIEVVKGKDLILSIILYSDDARELLTQIMAKGADINRRLTGGANYLMLASFYLYPESIDLLVDLGIDLTSTDDWGSNFLAYLPGNGRDDSYLLKHIKNALAKGLDPCSLSRNKRSKNYEILEDYGYKSVSQVLRDACLARDSN